MYLHLYFNGAKAIEDEKNLHKKIAGLQSELESGKRNPKHENLYKKYFTTKSTPVRGITVTAKDDILEEAKERYGYFALISNEIKDPIEALETYRNKDLVEKAFNDLKDRLGFNRLGVSSDFSLDGKLFVEFIALIYLSYIKKQMQEKKLFKRYTMQELLDELDIIECYERPDNALSDISGIIESMRHVTQFRCLYLSTSTGRTPCFIIILCTKVDCVFTSFPNYNPS